MRENVATGAGVTGCEGQKLSPGGATPRTSAASFIVGRSLPEPRSSHIARWDGGGETLCGFTVCFQVGQSCTCPSPMMRFDVSGRGTVTQPAPAGMTRRTCPSP